MKVQSLFNKTKKRKNLFIMFVFLFLLLIFVLFFHNILFKVFLANDFIKEKQYLFNEKKELFIENKKLKNELATKDGLDSQLFFALKENEELKKKLSYYNLEKEKRLVYNIIGGGKSYFFDDFLIKDNYNKTKVNDLVFAKFNILIGKITYKKDGFAEFSLFSKNKNKNFMYLVDGDKKILKVEAVGEGGGVLKVEVPRNIVLKNPEKIFLVDFKNPKYIIAKKVDKIFSLQDTNEIIYFQLLANPFLLSRVEILSEKQNAK